MFTQLAVGEPYLPMRGRPEGAVFDATPSGLVLLYNFARPDRDELDSMKQGASFEIRFTTLSNVMYVLTKCGSTPWQESPYNPHLSPGFDQLVRPENTNGYALTVGMIDASSNLVQTLRLIGLGNKFSCDLYDEMKRVFDMPFAAKEYYKTVSNIEASRSTSDLVNMANSHRWKLK